MRGMRRCYEFSNLSRGHRRVRARAGSAVLCPVRPGHRDCDRHHWRRPARRDGQRHQYADRCSGDSAGQQRRRVRVPEPDSGHLHRQSRNGRVSQRGAQQRGAAGAANDPARLQTGVGHAPGNGDRGGYGSDAQHRRRHHRHGHRQPPHPRAAAQRTQLSEDGGADTERVGQFCGFVGRVLRSTSGRRSVGAAAVDRRRSARVELLHAGRH